VARKKNKPQDAYEPIRCQTCGEEIYQRVQVTVKCPLGWRNLSKDGIRSSKVTVLGAYWNDIQWFCGCTPVAPPKNALAEVTDRRLKRPGSRWTKGNVPSSFILCGQNPLLPEPGPAPCKRGERDDIDPTKIEEELYP